MNFFKKLSIYGYISLLSILFTVVGFVVYVITTTTGFMAGTPVSASLIILFIITIILNGGLLFFNDKLPSIAKDVVIIAIGVLLAISICFFILERVTIAADVYFIPVNYPAAEETTLNISIFGVVCYVLGLITTMIVAFGGNPIKEN